MMTCEKCREELAEFALGHTYQHAPDSPAPATAAAVAEHLCHCNACRQEFADVQSAWSAFALALPPVAPSPALFDRLTARLDDQPPAADGVVAIYPARRNERIASYLLAASVLIGLTATYLSYRRPGEAAAEAAARQAAESLAQRLGNLQQMERLLKSDSVRLVSLQRPAASPDGEAFILWDLAAGQWHFFAELPVPPAGKSYQLWAIDDQGQRIPGPTLEVNRDGYGSAIVDQPAFGPHSAIKAMVTIEPQGGSRQPSGPVVLEAKF